MPGGSGRDSVGYRESRYPRRLRSTPHQPTYARIDADASHEQKARLQSLAPADVKAKALAGDAITHIYSHAPGNDAAIGGIKVTTDAGWFAARPSGTEDKYKIYAESFRSPAHLTEIQQAAKQLVDQALGG